MEESNQVLLLQIQEEIDFLEYQLSICEDEELAESIAGKLSSIKRRGSGLAKRAAIAGLAAAAVAGSGGAAKAGITDVSGNINVSRGAVPAQATDQSVRSAVDQALANPGQAQSASSEKGKMKTTVSGGINVSGRFGGGGDKKEKEKEKEKEQSNRKYRNKDEVLKQRAERQAELNKKNKFSTKYKYAVPTGTGGRFNTSQASGPNKVSSFKPVGTNKTGGTNFQRTKIVGDPTGSGSTGRTVGPKKYDRLFGKGGKFAPKGDGSRTIVPSSIGKRYSG